MQITVIGTGFVGVVTAAVFAKFGNFVWALDVDKEKVKLLNTGKIFFYEPNLEELVKENLKKYRLKFTSGYQEAVKDSEVIFICVGTPSAPNGQADLKYVFSAAQSLAPFIKDRVIIVIKSTVPPSTNRKIDQIIERKTKNKFFSASIPEFLKEGTAVADALNPQRVIIGSTNKWVVAKLLDLHKPLQGPKIVMRPESAQLTKYAANAYLATRIAFINEIANLCEKTGADIEEIIQGLGADERIGSHYWYPGPGYGGSCFPKDVKELAAFASGIGERDGLFEKIDRLNEERIPKLITKISQRIGRLSGKKVAVLGLSFKPNTSDMREAPSTKFIPLLLKSGATVIAYDPKAVPSARKLFQEAVSFTTSPYKAADGADVLLLLTEWDEFKQLNLEKIKKVMRGRIFIDTRNIYDPQKVKKQGFQYIGVGR